MLLAGAEASGNPVFLATLVFAAGSNVMYPLSLTK